MTAIAPEEAQIQIEGGGMEFRGHEIGGNMTVAGRAPKVLEQPEADGTFKVDGQAGDGKRVLTNVTH